MPDQINRAKLTGVEPGDLPLRLDPDAPTPLRQQLAGALREAIRTQRLRTGVRLPSSRALAEQLGVSRGVVTDAYEQLTAEGWLLARSGAGTTVAAVSTEPEPPRGAAAERPVFRFDFTPVSPDVSLFPRALWMRAMQRAATGAPDADLDYLGGHGTLALRTALADHLGRVRGVVARPDRIVVCSGYSQAINLIFSVLTRRGARSVALEDPSLPDHWRAADRAGLRTVPVSVDADGVRVDDVEAGGADAVVVTPNHQFPTGAVLSPPRRRALLRWAERSGAIVIEDDYDAEFRYDRRPLAAIQGLDPAHVAYVGTASKTLAPGLRLAWILCPETLADDLAGEKEASDSGSAAFEQLALAELVASGELDRHLRKVRAVYARRRARLAASLLDAVPGSQIEGAAAGVHLVLALPVALDRRRIAEALTARSIRAEVITARGAPLLDDRTRMVLGYGRLPEAGVGPAVAALAAAIREAS